MKAYAKYLQIFAILISVGVESAEQPTEWKLTGQDSEKDLYVQTPIYHVTGASRPGEKNGLLAISKLEFKKPQPSEYGEYRSIVTTASYECSSGKVAFHYYKVYADNNASGKLLVNRPVTNAEFESVGEETAAYQVLKEICAEYKKS